jgi:hypothetical protein
MALTLPRWMAAAVAGCLIVAAWFLSKPAPKSRPEDPRYELIRREQRASSASSAAAERLRDLILRDSVLAVISRAPRTDTSRVFVSSALPPVVNRLVTVLGVRVSQMRARPASPIDIAFVLDSARELRGRPMSRSIFGVTHVLPPVGGTHCLAIVRLMPRNSSWYSGSEKKYWTTYLTGAGVAAKVLGPCALYEAFGAPGAQIDGWLADGAWKYGLSGTLKRRSSSWSGEDYWRMPLWGKTAGWPLREYVTPVGYRCASGDLNACRQAILEPGADRAVRRTMLVGADRIAVPEYASNYWWWGATLGPMESAVLADMARKIGADQFRRFWTSDKPAAEAFFTATGQDIGTWTAAWARDTYGEVGRGPGTDASSIAWAAVLAVLGLAGAIVSSRRRQVA